MRLHQRSTSWSGYQRGLRVGHGGLPQPDVSQLMREREHLGGLGVRAIDEHQRRQVVRQGEAPNSCGSSLRLLLLPTTPLTMTNTPSPSACSMKRRSASVQVGIWRRASMSNPSGAPNRRRGFLDVVIQAR